MDSLKPFFCRVGSKKSILKILFKYIPNHTIYVETFVGSGALFFGIPKTANKYVINDKDTDLIRGYRILKKGSNIPFDIVPKTIKQIQKLYDKPIYTDDDFLLHELLKCNTFNSLGGNKIYKNSKHTAKLSQLPQYKQLFKNVTILNQDYISVLNKYDSDETFFYLDPPYVDSKELYEHSSIDYELMRDKLKSLKGYFLLSINDDAYIRKVFKEFIIIPILVKGIGQNTVGVGDRKELFIMNYSINV